MTREDEKRELDALCQAYKLDKDALTQKQKAEREIIIWRIAKKLRPLHSHGRRLRRLYWFREQFGNHQRHYEYRASLYSTGAAAEAIWQRLDAGTLNLDDAIHVLRNARRFNEEQNAKPEDLAASVELMLDQYDKDQATKPAPPPTLSAPSIAKQPATSSKQVTVRGPGGKFISPKAPSPKASARAAGRAVGGKKSAEIRRQKYGTAKPPRPASNRSEESMVFRAEIIKTICDQVDQFVTGRAARDGIEDYFSGKARQDFVDWIESGLRYLFDDLQRLKRDARSERLARVGQTRFKQACEVLGITATFGKHLDVDACSASIDLKLVRTRHHERVAPYHPDKKKTNGSPYTDAEREEYQSINEARAILEDYIRQLGPQQ